MLTISDNIIFVKNIPAQNTNSKNTRVKKIKEKYFEICEKFRSITSVKNNKFK